MLCQSLILRDRRLSQQFKAPLFRSPGFNHHRVETFQISQDIKLQDIGVVADIAFGDQLRISLAPFFCGHAKYSFVEQVCLVGIDKPFTGFCGLQLWDEVIADQVCVQAVLTLVRNHW